MHPIPLSQRRRLCYANLSYPQLLFVVESFRTKYRFVEVKKKKGNQIRALTPSVYAWVAVSRPLYYSLLYHAQTDQSESLCPDDPETGVDLVNNVSASEGVPVGASLRDGIWDTRVAGGQSIRLLEQIDVQASTDVPGDMAVEGPHTRIVGLVAKHDEAGGDLTGGLDLAGLNGEHVATVGIAGVGGLGGAVPFANTGVDDPEVVAVKMHGMGDGGGVDEVEEDGVVAAEVVDVAVSVEGGLSVVGVEEKRVIVVDAESLAVHVEQVAACVVEPNSYVEDLLGAPCGGRGP